MKNDMIDKDDALAALTVLLVFAFAICAFMSAISIAVGVYRWIEGLL